MKDSELFKKYGEIYVHIVHLQLYLESCLTDLQKVGMIRDHFLLDREYLDL